MNRDLVVRIIGDSSGFEKAVKSSSSGLKDFGDKTKSEGSNIADGMNKVAIGMGAVGLGLTVASKKATDSVVDMVQGIKRLSRETGENETEMSRLLYAMQRTGVSAQDASAMFGIFQKQIQKNNESTADASLKQQDLAVKIQVTQKAIRDTADEIRLHGDKTGDLKLKLDGLNVTLAQQKAALEDVGGPLAKLGVATVDASGKSRDFSAILLDVADKFKAMPNGAEKTADAMKLFGRSGKDLLPVLNQGADGIKTLEKKADDLGITLTGSNLKKVNDYIQVQKNLKDQQTALTMQIGTEAIPMQTKFIEAQQKLLQGVLKLPGPLHEAAIGVIAFGGPVLTGTAAVLGFTSNLIQSWPAIATFGARLFAMSGEAAAATGVLTGTRGAVIALEIAAASPVAPIVLAVVGLAAIYEAIQAVRELKAAWDGANASAGQSDALDNRAINAIRNNPNLSQAQKSARLRGLMDPGYRASGGPVKADTAYIVGEEGPELFIPGTNGNIVPNGGSGKSIPTAPSASTPSSGPTMAPQIVFSPTFQIGMYAGMPIEKRQIAVEIWREIVREARSNGVQLPQIGVSPQ